MRRAASQLLGLALATASCAPGARIANDAQATSDGTTVDAGVPSCGNGILDEGELCDDGALNGGPQSMCTIECLRPSFTVPAAHLLTFPSTIDSFVELTPFRIGTILEGSIGISVALEVHVDSSFGTNQVPQLVTFGVFSQATSIARLQFQTPDEPGADSPLWTEKGADGAPHLYFADVTAGTVHEVPYPFQDGTDGHLVACQGISTVLIDVSATTHELLVATITGRSSSDIHVTSARFPSGGTCFYRGT